MFRPVPNPMTIVRRIRRSRLLASQRGAAMLEFALVSVPLIAMLIATIETALISFSQQAIETSAEAAARLIMTGQAQAMGMTQQQFHDQACTTLPSYLSCANLMVDVQRASSFSSVNLTAPTLTYNPNGTVSNSFSYNIGAGNDIVIVRLMYLWPVSGGGFGLSLANAGNGKHLLISTNVAKTEAI